MVKVYFKNGINGSFVDWTPYFVNMDPIGRRVESENPGEAGIIVYDNTNIQFNKASGNAVDTAFSGNLTTAQRYIFAIYAIQSDGETETQLFEGIADFSTIEEDDDNNLISFDIVDKLSAFNILSNSRLQRDTISDAVADRLSFTEDYLVTFTAIAIPDLGFGYEIALNEVIYDEGHPTWGDLIQQTTPVLLKGEMLIHTDPAKFGKVYLVKDSGVYTKSGSQYTWIKVFKPTKAKMIFSMSYANDQIVNLSELKNSIVIDNNSLTNGELITIESEAQIEKLEVISDATEQTYDYSYYTFEDLPVSGYDNYIYRTLDDGNQYMWVNSEWLLIGDKDTKFYKYDVKRYQAGESPMDWPRESLIYLFDDDLAYGQPDNLTPLRYYSKAYYDQADICIYGNDSYSRSVVKGFDAIKIIEALVEQAWDDITVVNNSGASTFPLALDYYDRLIYYEPFGEHPYDALKMLANSLQCYLFFDRTGQLVLQKKSTINANTVRTYDSSIKKYSGIKRLFWDKLVDTVTVTIKTGVLINEAELTGSSTKTVNSDIRVKSRNELEITAFAPNTVIMSQQDLNNYAATLALAAIEFYGKRHPSYSLEIPLNDDMLQWEMLDLLTVSSVSYFFEALQIDPINFVLSAEMVGVTGYAYQPVNAVTPKRELASGGGSGTTIQNVTQSTVTNTYTGGAIPVGTQPVYFIPRSITMANINTGSVTLGVILENHELEEIVINITTGLQGVFGFTITDGVNTLATIDSIQFSEAGRIVIPVGRLYAAETTITANFTGTASAGAIKTKLKALGEVTT